MEVLPTADTELSLLNHELMNSLAVIEGFASLLERRPDAFTAETVSEHAASIGRSARRLRALVQAMRDARRLETSELEVTRQPVDVVPLVREVARDYSVAVVDAPESVVALVDPVRVRQVVDNLLANSVKFSPASTPVELRMWVADGSVYISVHDHGLGVPVERRVGLYISRGIARAHDGDLSADDTTFVLRLPLR